MTPAPMIPAIRIVRMIASHIGTPALLKSFPSTIPESASSDPTDRSIPAVMTTNVMPIETTHRIETLVSMFSMFAWVKKCVWVNEK